MRVRRRKNDQDLSRTELVSPELIERCKAGDERAWAELVETTHREVYTLCLRILRRPEDAADATQDTYVKAWRGLAGFRGEASFTTWLYRVATNAAISRHRQRARRSERESLDLELHTAETASPADAESAASTRLDLAELESALARLPEHHRMAVVLRDVYGFSIEEIASRLGVSSTAAKVRVHRARKALKDQLFEERDDEQEDGS